MTDDEVVDAMLRNHAFICKTERLSREVLNCAIVRLRDALEKIDCLEEELQMLRLGDEF